MKENKKDGPPVTWWQCEPRRLARDRAEISDRFPTLDWHGKGAGGWTGKLPRWPFERPEPPRLIDLIGFDGLQVEVEYGHAYPMVAPLIRPIDPEHVYIERTDHKWHVMGDGSLCLLQEDAAWTGRNSIVELLLKAAGWRVEYALMKAGVIETMTLHGIVVDDQFDPLVAAAVETDSTILDHPAHAADDGGPT